MINWANGFILVYSITRKKSFQDIQQIMKEIKRNKGQEKKVPIFICGNKVDLSHKRMVSLKDARNWSSQHRYVLYELSALTWDQTEAVTHMFNRLAVEILRYKEHERMLERRRRTVAVGCLDREGHVVKRTKKKQVVRTKTL